MGLAGVRTPDNMALFDANRPQAVVYFDVDYERNPKGQPKYTLKVSCYYSSLHHFREQLLEKQVSYAHTIMHCLTNVCMCVCTGL